MKQLLLDIVKKNGVAAAVALEQADIIYDRSFRDICVSNGCGRYGRNYMCPPDIGDADTLMNSARAFPRAILYQTIHKIEDSFDFEGMTNAKRIHSRCSAGIQSDIKGLGGGLLHLGAGACGICERCAKLDCIPCRSPEDALPSLEAYCVFVSETANNAGLKYINGVNTVTYFGMILYGDG